MSNLSQYRTSLGIFAIGLLWLVSEVVGEDGKPGPLTSATKSIAHRSQSPKNASTDDPEAGYELAVSKAIPSDPGANAPRRSPWEVRPDDAAAELGERDSAAEPVAPVRLVKSDAIEPQPADPDVGVIHK